MLLPEIKQRAIDLLKKRYSAGLVLRQLEQDFPNNKMPTERTINRWKNQAEILERQISSSQRNNQEILEKYWETHPVPKWLQNLYLVKIENGEIKPQ